MAHILVVEDDKEAAFYVRNFLESHGFQVTLAHDGYAALLAIEKDEVDLAIVDIVMPRLDGLHLCRLLRSREKYLPILILSAMSGKNDQLQGFEVGADHYLTKPVDCDELLAKIKAVTRLMENAGNLKQTSSPPAEKIIMIGYLMLDMAKHQVTRDGVLLQLTPLEFSLLSFLAQRPGRVYSCPQLLRAVWGYKNDCYQHTVESHINRLRRKIEINPSRPQVLLTVRGAGYKIMDTTSAAKVTTSSSH